MPHSPWPQSVRVPRHGLEIDGCFLAADGPRQHHMEGSAASTTFWRCGVGMRCRTTFLLRGREFQVYTTDHEDDDQGEQPRSAPSRKPNLLLDHILVFSDYMANEFCDQSK
jgi:hypothetical protein